MPQFLTTPLNLVAMIDKDQLNATLNAERQPP
jgi:hypothetical protein